MALRINRLAQSLGDLCANEQEAEIGKKCENQQECTRFVYYRFAFANKQEAKISTINLAYYRFSFANEREAEIASCIDLVLY